MTKNLLFAITFIATLNSIAGDTTNIRVHDKTDMTWYGNYDAWGEFPDGSDTYRKIYLHYTMGCASSGCSDWDYTTKIEVLHRTGDIDSNFQQSPTFSVNGAIVDSVMFSDSVYVYFWDTSSSSVDSVLSQTLEIIQFNDINNPTVPTDTLIVFQSGYYNLLFDSVGVVFDSIYVYPDTIITQSYNNCNNGYYRFHHN